jgi:DNA-binding NtrC family response regulator
VRELRNLIESMVVLSHGRAIGLEDIPKSIRDQGGARNLPVPVGAIVREEEGARGRELEFIVRSLVELKLQMEELRRRVDDDRVMLSEVSQLGAGGGGGLSPIGGLEPPGLAASPNVVTVTPGMTMAQIERASIEAALRETRGNRRRAAELLDIGERTLYRKLKEYGIPITD